MLLGSPQVSLNATPVDPKRRAPRALLAYRAVTAHAHSREALTEVAYPEAPREQGYSTFRQTLTTLRLAIIYRKLLNGIEKTERGYHRADVPERLRRVAEMSVAQRDS